MIQFGTQSSQGRWRAWFPRCMLQQRPSYDQQKEGDKKHSGHDSFGKWSEEKLGFHRCLIFSMVNGIHRPGRNELNHSFGQRQSRSSFLRKCAARLSYPSATPTTSESSLPHLELVSASQWSILMLRRKASLLRSRSFGYSSSWLLSQKQSQSSE